MSSDQVVKELKRLEPSDISFLANRYRAGKLLQEAVKAAHNDNVFKARENLRKADKNMDLCPIGGKPAEVFIDALMCM